MKNNRNMRFFRIHIMIVTCLLPLFTAKAQSFRIIELPNQEQLPVANVHRIMQDSEGFMWYATEEGGLCRDDGYKIEIFRSDKNHPSLLESNNITCITEDRKGRIWFGTTKGAYILDKKDYSIHRLDEKGIQGAYVPELLGTSDGSVWISASGHMFRCRYAPAEQKTKDLSLQTDSFPVVWKGHACNVTHFHEDSKGNLLALLNGGGILRLMPDGGHFEEMPWDDSVGSPSYITEGRTENDIWLATWGQGIVKYNPSAPKDAPYITLQPATIGKDGFGSFRSQILNIRYDKRHNLLWAVSMDDLYAYRIDKDMLSPYPTEEFLPKGKKILDHVTIDRDGNLWIPGYSPHTFIVQASESQIRRDPVKAMSDITGYKVMVDRIVRENDRYYWIWQGRTNLSLYDAQNQIMVFSDRTAQPAPLSTAKCMEKRHHAPGIWTCNGKKLFKVWNRDMDIFQSEIENLKIKENIRTLFDNRKDVLYIGTDNAIYKYNYKTDKCRLMVSATGSVLDLTESDDGTVYFISESKGFCKLDRQGDTAFNVNIIHSNENTPSGFHTLATAPDGTLWTGTSCGNVCHYLPAKNKLVDDERAGNKNGDAVKNIIVAPTGHIWILCDKYLKEYNPENGASRLLHSSSPQIGMDYFHTIRLEGDSICLGGIGAFCMISPSGNLPGDEISPTVTSWTIDGIHHVPGVGERHLHIDSATEQVDIFVSTFDYLHTDTIQYAYRLNSGSEWTTLPKGTNKITLKQIPYGTSELEVKVRNRYGIWQDAVKCLTLDRELHWIITVSCYLLLIMAIIGGVALYARKRKKRITPCTSRTNAPIESEENSHEELPATVMSSKADDDFLRKAIETIEKNIDNADYSVEQFSNDLFMSRMNMYRKLQALTSQKPSEFIRDIRLKKAVELMQTTDLSVSEIVDRVGFGTSRYFSKCFKEKYGISPSQYRSHNSTANTSAPSSEEQM